MDYKEKCKIIDGNPKENKQKTQTNLDLASEVREREARRRKGLDLANETYSSSSSSFVRRERQRAGVWELRDRVVKGCEGLGLGFASYVMDKVRNISHGPIIFSSICKW